MPLVVFNYDSQLDGPLSGGAFEEVLELPRWAHNKKWTLRSVNALYYDDAKEDFRGIELSFPEIMNTQNILFSNVASGNVVQSDKVFRFYNKCYQLSEDVGNDYRRTSVFGIVSEYPNLELGEHRLEKSQISCRVKPFGGRVGTTTGVHSCTIILSFDE